MSLMMQNTSTVVSAENRNIMTLGDALRCSRGANAGEVLKQTVSARREAYAGRSRVFSIPDGVNWWVVVSSTSWVAGRHVTQCVSDAHSLVQLARCKAAFLKLEELAKGGRKAFPATVERIVDLA
jgi:hypothetical protein